ncbi:MAG: alpha/beta hydrolase, partial [Oscillospiraceae bacterium]|nr:alpha/beta hydrolase [Oscillospiraceae bacterium]
DAEGGDFRGLIVVAGSPRKLGEIIRDQNLAQLDDLPDNVRESARQQITALLEMFDAFQDMPDEDVKQIDIGGASGYYIKDVDARPASFYLADSVKPILIVQGSKDFQIIADVDFAAYQTLLGDRANATLKLYDGLNHLMMPHVNGTIEDYELPANVDAQVITDVADWILSM